MMARIFLVFRPYDGDPIVYRLDEHLRSIFGGSNVVAINRLTPGADTRMEIARFVDASSVVLVVIGRRWLEELGRGHGQDLVQMAIQAALEAPDRTVIPVLVEGALLPDAAQLPAGLGALAYRTPLNLRYDPDFSEDAARLIATIQQYEAAAQQAQPITPPVVEPPRRPAPVQHLRTVEDRVPQQKVQPPTYPRAPGSSNPIVATLSFIGRVIGGILKFFASVVNTIVHQMLRSTIALVMNIILMLIIGGFSLLYVSALLNNNFDFGLAFSAVIEQIRAFVSSLSGR